MLCESLSWLLSCHIFVLLVVFAIAFYTIYIFIYKQLLCSLFGGCVLFGFVLRNFDITFNCFSWLKCSNILSLSSCCFSWHVKWRSISNLNTFLKRQQLICVCSDISFQSMDCAKFRTELRSDEKKKRKERSECRD